MLTAFIEKHKLNKGFEDTAQNWYTPLAEQIKMHHISAGKPIIVAINGCQGSGKSTLTDYLKDYLENIHGLKIANLSLDDFYFSQIERESLAEKIHPLFKTRGVPGTHDIKLAMQIIKQLVADSGTIKLPRFDKSTDNPFSNDCWPEISTPVDIVIFEGWCVGAQHQITSMLQQPVNTLESEQDQSGVWRQYVNQQLKNVYEPLYSNIDFWIMLKAPSFENVYAWRLEQEQKLAKQSMENAQGIMSEQQIASFIQYYQRLTEHMLNTLPSKSDVVFELDSQRQILARIDKD
jgi:D-glycerate 3-kinase